MSFTMTEIVVICKNCKEQEISSIYLIILQLFLLAKLISTQGTV